MSGARAAATAAAIEDAALDLTLDRGYENVTVDLICERAGISQRTFFNHFPAKDDALLGRDLPRLDERAARAFILADGPILIDALGLIDLPADPSARRLADRMRVISTTPSLLVRQMERIAAIDDQLQEVIALRLQHASPEVLPEEREQEASMLTHLLSGAIRWIASHAQEDDPAFTGAIQQAREALTRILRDSAAAAQT